jgi:D-beta-D-heptose 7-phosphate kinase/D-beta-D-heptose 1-phosphate adenosyltransferase
MISPRGKKMNRNILVIGDAILDETVVTDVVGTSLETPTLKTEYKSSNIHFGGASNVVENMVALGAKVTYMTVLGNDSYLTNYQSFNSDKLDLVYETQEIPNTVKTRIWVQTSNSSYKYLQINRGQRIINNQSTLNKLLSRLDLTQKYDCAVLVDYSRGLLDTPENAEIAINKLRELGCPIIVSSQLSSNCNNYPLFKGVDYMCMNDVEAKENYQSFDKSHSSVERLSEILKTNACVTLGKDGFVFYNNGQIIKESAYPIRTIDTVGAGDAFLAAFSVYINDDLRMCNKWAALSTTKLGTETPHLSELYEL